MTAVIAAVFVASLLGSLHCAGMCGGVLAFCAGTGGGENDSTWRAPVAYNIGRAVMYIALGAIAGFAGGAIDFGGAMLGWQRTAAVLAGALMILFGLVALGRACGVGAVVMKNSPRMQRMLKRGFDFAFRWPPVTRAFIIGILTGLLPCGWLWAFLVVATGTGHPVNGAITMAVFWTGTLPVMLALGVSVQKLSGSFRRYLPRISAAMLIMIGLVTVAGRLNMPAMAAGVSPERADDLVRQVETIDQQRLPCCEEPADDDASTGR